MYCLETSENERFFSAISETKDVNFRIFKTKGGRGAVFQFTRSGKIRAIFILKASKSDKHTPTKTKYPINAGIRRV